MTDARHIIVIGILATMTATTFAQDSPEVHEDPPADAIARRTDLNGDGLLNPLGVLPDLARVAIGGWGTNTPISDPFSGRWEDGEDADLFRVDLVFRGLVNPPGPNGLSGPEYEPFRYGPSPVYGFVEFDIDEEPDTGGEIDFVANRILGNAARFGGRLSDELGDRAAVSGDDLDNDLRTLPEVERSGEEWHLSLCGCDDFQVIDTAGDPTPGSFDLGDTWILQGRFIHRSHAFTEYSFAFGGSRPGEYDPIVRLRFKSELSPNRTIISLVAALTQEGAALLVGEPLQDWDLDASNHTSIEEMTQEIRFAALNANDPGPGTSFDLLRDWADEDHAELEEFRDPAEWEVNALFGTAYLVQDPDALYVWTDVAFDHQFGDVDGDGQIGRSDQDAIMLFVAQVDGTGEDDDGVINGQIYLSDFGPNFLLFDLNYDGSVNAQDVALIGYNRRGDVNIDRALDSQDVGVVDQLNGTVRGHPAYNPAADFNSDDRIDAIDSAVIRRILLFEAWERAVSVR